MCGISGVFLRKPHAPHEAARAESGNRRMIAHQRLRGPDAQGAWKTAGVFFGHTRLAIMDPLNDGSRQPAESGRYVLAFNGEIYNFRQLRADLSRDVDFRTDGDTEVLLRALDRWGVKDTLDALNGIFAFAAYDKQEDALHLVRDRLGVKPLYAYRAERALWFASSPAAIVKGVGGRWDLDYAGLYAYFRLGAPFGERTLFRGILRVLPAEHLIADSRGGLRGRRYWTPRVRPASLDEAVPAAVRRQREAHVPSALFLSGGVDSTTLAAFLDGVDLFHLDSEEKRYAEYVAGFMKRPLRTRSYADGLEFDAFNESYVETSGEPSASAPIPFLISHAMRDAGYKVAFSGNGADELFLGYARTPAPELREANWPAHGYEAGPSRSRRDQFRRIFRKAENFSVPRLREAGEDLRNDEWITRPLTDLPPGFPESAHTRWFELQTYVQYDLNATLDFASMSCSLEVRVPFLDHVLVEAVLSTSANVLVTADVGRKTPLKMLLKRRGFHPLLWARKKRGFSVPAAAGGRRKKRLRRAVMELETQGFLVLHDCCAPGSRDREYLSVAAHAFAAWKKKWIDTGFVQP